MLLLVVAVKLVAEVALLALVGRGVLGLLAGQGREANVFYRLFVVLTRPVVQATRRLTPRAVIDRHVPLVAALWLATVWLAALAMKIQLCVAGGVVVCW